LRKEKGATGKDNAIVRTLWRGGIDSLRDGPTIL
jgi:hypothetical protein